MSDLVGDPEDRLSRVAAHIILDECFLYIPMFNSVYCCLANQVLFYFDKPSVPSNFHFVFIRLMFSHMVLQCT